MAKKPKPEGKKYSYMDTYGDLVTLLMCFFVLLFAMSTVTPQKYNAFAEALSERFGPSPPTNPSWVAPSNTSASGSDYADSSTTSEPSLAPGQTLPAEFSQLAEAIQQQIEQNGMEGEVSVEQGANGTVFLRLNNNLLFEGNQADLSLRAEEFLDFLGQCFIQVESDIFQVQLLGHTASIAGSAEDDSVLAARRAGTVQSYLEREAGFTPYKMTAIGKGRFYPIADNADPAARAQNRRVDIVVIGNNPELLGAALADAAKIYFPSDDTSFFEGTQEELPGTTVDEIPPVGEGVDLANLTDEQVQGLLDALEEEMG